MTLTVVLIVAAGVIATVIDVRERRVPNVLTMGLASLGLMLAILGISGVTVGEALAGLAVGLGLLLVPHIVGATGAGDVKLLAAFGTLLGPAGIFNGFLRAAIVGGAIALALAVVRGRLWQTLTGTAALVTTQRRAAVAMIEAPGANNRFPYAPAIAIGVALAAFGW